MTDNEINAVLIFQRLMCIRAVYSGIKQKAKTPWINLPAII
jgi:DNA-binding helix-hairpin-helix protein with protein kinase domain